MGYIPNDLCIAKGVKKLPPAHAGLLDMQNKNGDFNVWRYWTLPKIETKANEKINSNDLAEEAYLKL